MLQQPFTLGNLEQTVPGKTVSPLAFSFLSRAPVMSLTANFRRYEGIYDGLVLQGGRKAAAAYARKQQLSNATLDMLADMRKQYASMLAEAGFLTAGDRHRHRGDQGMDDVKQTWNLHARQPVVVFALQSCHDLRLSQHRHTL